VLQQISSPGSVELERIGNRRFGSGGDSLLHVVRIGEMATPPIIPGTGRPLDLLPGIAALQAAGVTFATEP
jgi:hypothetical protein